ncbi:hypothetical protein LJ207_10670 [Halanaerobium sp. Z-7514]|uniref:DUF4468 domain-containing protein n=1 Tax=Halanaerobium polyolivorans TaxID=2886943 RepID=A0AAW4X1V9_9FIRM|nr:hypothetical protein [Halanaerobium polyolivorans]MCC3145787.1 hypothetical protein [Halanaerobium polyolivorans]
MKYLKKLFICILLITILMGLNSVKAQNITKSEYGLEVEKPQVYVHIVNEVNEKVNITEKNLRNKAENMLRRNNIDPLNQYNGKYYISVYVQTIRDNAAPIFHTKVSFYRSTFFQKPKEEGFYVVDSTAWDDGTVGEGDRSFIMSAIEKNIEAFINEFHKANSF